MRLARAHRRLLQAMAEGHFLKSHRDADGRKTFQLHPLDGPPQVIRPSAVEFLRRHGLIDSNKKFPVATFWLTEQGKAAAEDSP